MRQNNKSGKGAGHSKNIGSIINTENSRRTGYLKKAAVLLLLCTVLCACRKEGTGQTENTSVSTPEAVPETMEESNITGAAEDVTESAFQSAAEAGKEMFRKMELTKSIKGINHTNPIMTQRFGADPYAMVYGDTVYFYMTADEFEYDAKGEILENSYSKIRSINVVSTKDMVNFTDHGSITVGGEGGAAKWARNSWAPAAAWKRIDGKDKFFLYFADNGGGIGVLTADSPTGPFSDPLGEALISRKTPNCANVLWLFDPAVLVDEDGRAYLYFGGGVPEGRTADPGTARVVELGEDMVSIKGEPVAIDVPYLFEDSGIHKHNNKYYYTYCTNWQVDQAGTDKYGFHNAEIVSLESDSPMGPFTFKEVILENPGKYCGLYGNNHHCVFEFENRWYITYHSRRLEKAMGVEHGYRCTNIEEFTMGDDGTIGIIRQTTQGREQIRPLNPYEEVSAVTMSVCAGPGTVAAEEEGSEFMVLSDVETGDFLKVKGVDFGENSPGELQMWVKVTDSMEETAAISVTMDVPRGNGQNLLAILPLRELTDNPSADGYQQITVPLENEAVGVHDVFLVFSGSNYEVKSWQFRY